MNKTIIEIRAAEGGQDSKLLVEDMAGIYQKACSINNFTCDVKQWRDGFIVLWIEGKKAHEYFLQESGSHRWQRIPPTERKGRVQTSTVTVAVMTEAQNVEVIINPADIERWTSRGTGPGGQNKNKVETSVFIKHIPTGIICKGENSRSQHQNEQEAYRLLNLKLYELEKKKLDGDVIETRNNQIGTGERSDKRRTYRDKDDLVIDHITNKSARLKDIMRGKINLLHKV